MIIYIIMTAVTPFVQPRYNYFVYVLLCLELAMKTIEESRTRDAASKAQPGSQTSDQLSQLCGRQKWLEYLVF